MLGRYWIAWVAWLAIAGGATAGEMATARVVELEDVDGTLSVVIGAGRLDGLGPAEEVTLLREAEPIVHPLSGEVLGVPQEPVGKAQIYEVKEKRARGRLVKGYSAPQVGDLVEYERQGMIQEAEMPPAVDKVIERVKGLEQDMVQYRKYRKTIAAYPVFAQQVWDELKAAKSYLVELDERLIALEEQQGDDRSLLNSVISGEYRAEETKEFTIRYSPDADVKLKVEGTTLVISVERDSLHVEEVVEDGPMEGEELRLEEEEGGQDVSFFDSTFIQVGSLALIGVLGAVLYFLMRRHQDNALNELDEFDEEEYLDDDEEDDEEEEY